MSRSWKKPWHWLTKPSSKSSRRACRRRIKVELQKPEPDPIILIADTKHLGLDDYGTVYGFEFDENPDVEMEKKARRK